MDLLKMKTNKYSKLKKCDFCLKEFRISDKTTSEICPQDPLNVRLHFCSFHCSIFYFEREDLPSDDEETRHDGVYVRAI